MPLFNESFELEHQDKESHPSPVLRLRDQFERQLPATSIEFNPPPVDAVSKQDAGWWRAVAENPSPQDAKVLKSLAQKHQSLTASRDEDTFISVTDSAAGILRLHNLAMIELLGDADFCTRLDIQPLIWEPRRVVLHLTRNHSIHWLRSYLERCKRLGFDQFLLITGDPLKDMRLPGVDAQAALNLGVAKSKEYRLKNSIELVHFVRSAYPEAFIGVGHNPFLKPQVAEKHLRRKLAAGCQFIVTQPVAYYDECWRVMGQFSQFLEREAPELPLMLGVFNYSVPTGPKGFRQEVFDKRHKFWKRLFGFVPSGVRQDYERGLNGVEIIARSINALQRRGYFHFDVMNAERMGATLLRNKQRLAHESERLAFK